MVVGIDPGAKGGVVALDPWGKIRDTFALPTTRRRGKTEPDVITLADWLDNQPTDHVIVGIEEPLRFAANSQALRSMSIGFGMIHGMLLTKRYNHHVVQVSEWQREMLGKRTTFGNTKEQALKVARELSPKTYWHLPKSRKKVPHDGVVDAFLIATYVRKIIEKRA